MEANNCHWRLKTHRVSCGRTLSCPRYSNCSKTFLIVTSAISLTVLGQTMASYTAGVSTSLEDTTIVGSCGFGRSCVGLSLGPEVFDS